MKALIVVLIAAGAGGIGWLIYKSRGGVTPPVPVPPEPTPDDGDDEGGDKAPQGATCARVGRNYDVIRWASPAHVAAGLTVLGFPTGPTLTSSADKAQIVAFKKKALALKLDGTQGAKTSWLHGEADACMLLALSAAEKLNSEGKWITG